MDLNFLYNTLWIAAGTLFLCLTLALPLSFLLERTDVPGAQIWSKIFSLPYILPSYLLAIAWIVLANPQVGVFNIFLRSLVNDPELKFFNIYSLGGIVFVESTALFSILYIQLRISLRKMNPELEEAARLCGASPMKSFRLVTLPLLKKPLIAGLLTIFLGTLASFGVPAMLGASNRIYVLTTAIYSLLRTGNDEGFDKALLLSFFLGLFSLFIVLLIRLLDRKKINSSGARVSRKQRLALRSLKWPVFLFLALLWFLICGLPLLSLLASSFSAGGVSLFDVSHWNLKAWHYVLFELPNFRKAILNTLQASMTAALLVLILSFSLSIFHWHCHHKNKKWGLFFCKFVEDFFVFVYSLPGTVLAIFLIFVSIKFSFLGLADSLNILILAYFLKTANLGQKIMLPATMDVHKSLVEAARMCGANSRVLLYRIWLPLLKAALWGAFFICVMPVLGELTTSLLLYGPETETVGVQLYQLQEYADRPSAAVVGTLLLAGVLLLNFMDRSHAHEE